MSVNLNHGCAKETTFKFKLSGVQNNLISNELPCGIQIYLLFLFPLKNQRGLFSLSQAENTRFCV